MGRGVSEPKPRKTKKEIAAYARAHYAENHDKIRDQRNKAYSDNPEKYKKQQAAYNARVKKDPVKYAARLEERRQKKRKQAESEGRVFIPRRSRWKPDEAVKT